MSVAGYTYSFLDVNATIIGPGGIVNLANGAGTSAEGITFSHTSDKNTAVTGAAGGVMHCLSSSLTGTIKVRLLKSSPANGQLSVMYNTQRLAGGILWGKNIITIGNSAIGDNIVGTYLAFTKHPDIVYATEGNTNEWLFDGSITPELGNGLLGLALAAAGSFF